MSEYKNVEKPFLEKLESLGWKVIDHGAHGELVSQDPNDEPAFELLKKIKDERNYDEEKS